MDSNKDFAEFIRRIRSGDEDAARELIQRYEPQLRIIARVHLTDPRLRSVLDSMDICQSIYAKFFAGATAGQFHLESPKDLMNLLAKMVSNKVIDKTRATNAKKKGGKQLNPLNIDILDLPGADETPSTIVSHLELLKKVRERLSPEERHLADLRRDGQTWDAISAKMGEPAEALRKRLQRAIDRVQGELGL